MGFSLGVNSNQSTLGGSSLGDRVGLLDVRVRDIVLSSNHPRFEEVGGWAGIGTIIYDTTEGGLNSTRDTVSFARPLFSNHKFYPLINEIVAIITIADPVKNQESGGEDSKLNFYFPPANVWNSQHHNALPDVKVGNLFKKTKTYKEVDQGSPNYESIEETPIFLGTTFKEKNQVFPLYFYEGDYIMEGRWGNTLRLGSTVKFPDFPNTWSNAGDEGDPITILRVANPNKNSTQAGWLPTLENTIEDLSSIYLTSTQKLPFFASSFKTDSFGNDPAPTSPSEYEGNQIILDSGRLILNAKSDGVLISSPTSVHLSAGNSINLDSSQRIVLASGEINLVSRNATQRAVLGDELVFHLQNLIPVLEGLAKACSTASAGPYPVPSLISAGPALETALGQFKKALNGKNPKILSNKVKLQ